MENKQLCTLRFDELRITNVKRCEEVFHPVNDWTPTDWATALAGECGEACNLIKKLRRLDGADHCLDTMEERQRITGEIAKELADAVTCADLIAARLGIDLGEAVAKKFNEVSHRRNCSITLPVKYPFVFSAPESAGGQAQSIAETFPACDGVHGGVACRDPLCWHYTAPRVEGERHEG